MKTWSLAVLALILVGMAGPAAAAEMGRYSYITVEKVEITLENERAVVGVDYQVDEGIQLLVLLIGKSDLKNKLNDVLLFEGGRFREVGLDHAVMVVDDAAYDYGDGSYWFPEHEFGILVPEIAVKTPQVTRSFPMSSSFPNGIGYFGTA